MATTSIVWFRRDLRLLDNPALHAALSAGEKILPLFIWSPEEEGIWAPGGAAKWWLHHSLLASEESLKKIGSTLVIRKGESPKVLLEVARESGAKKIFWNRLYEPMVIKRDTLIKETLQSSDLEPHSMNGALLIEPWEVKNQSGKPFQVFTPYWKSVRSALQVGEIIPAPERVNGVEASGLSVSDLKLLPSIPWDSGLKEAWRPGEERAIEGLRRFLKNSVGDYSELRDLPSRVGTSRMSPHLHFGEISPRVIWHEADRALREKGGNVTAAGIDHFLREIGWREFAHHLLYHFPHTPHEPLRENFKDFPWVEDEKLLRAWKMGQTGYPIIDAGMRELWRTGWMHNRVRMIVSSFLVKDLLISWYQGALWFWDTLVDASLANNTLGWQWSGGCGADAAPYFRIFNPTSQGEKFDSEGEYVRRWVPELSKMPNRYIHRPWEAPRDVLSEAEVQLGVSYPERIVDHGEARNAALRAFDQIKR